MSGRGRLPYLVLASVAGIVLAGNAAEGQVLPLKGPPGGEDCGWIGLPSSPSRSEPDRVQRSAVDSLVSAGSRAAILGEHDLAGAYLREALAMDPTNAVVAYRLARTLDDQGAADAAAIQYCRYLALSPSEPDAAAVRDRVRALTGDGTTIADPWAISMEAGIGAYTEGRYRDAIQAFSRAIEFRMDRPEAYYNRALAYELDGRSAFAINDYEMYLVILPDAADAAVIQGELARLRTPAGLAAPTVLRRSGVSPAAALAQGLVIPGLGQQATGRPALGALVLAAAGGAVYLGFREAAVVRREGAYDPFGNYYEYDVRSLERPHVAKGIGAAAVIALLGAIESYIYADRRSGGAATAIEYPASPVMAFVDCATPDQTPQSILVVGHESLSGAPCGSSETGPPLACDQADHTPSLLERPCQ